MQPNDLIALLHRYMAAFNRGDYDALVQFYCDDVVLVIANGAELHGKQAIVDFYRGATAKTGRTIRIVQTLAQNALIAAELESEFLALEDVPDFPAGPMHKGDRLCLNTLVLYELRDGAFSRIRSAPLKREWRRIVDEKRAAQ